MKSKEVLSDVDKRKVDNALATSIKRAISQKSSWVKPDDISWLEKYRMQSAQGVLTDKAPRENKAGIHLTTDITRELKIEKSKSHSNPSNIALVEDITDTELCKQLGIKCEIDGRMTVEQVKENDNKLWSLEEFIEILEQQMYCEVVEIDEEGYKISKPREGILSINDRTNIFYTKSNDGLRVIPLTCYFSAKYGIWRIGTCKFGDLWTKDYSVISRQIIH